MNANGTFSYAHDGSEFLTDSFAYEVRDAAGHTAQAVVTINVTPVNDNSPVANPDAITVAEGGTATALAGGATSVLANDTDADLPNDTRTVDTVPVTAPAYGTLVLNANGTFRYVHDGSGNFVDGFAYLVRDAAGHSAQGTVVITVTPVNDPPVARDDLVSVAEDTPRTIPASVLLSNDSPGPAEESGQVLRIVRLGTPAHGTVSYDGTSVIYTPDANYHGGDSFSYTIDDGNPGLTAEANVVLTIASVNDVPVPADDSYEVDEDGSLTVPAPGVTANDDDVDDDPLSASVVRLPSLGTLSLDATGAFTYVPRRDANGTDTFTYRLNDGTANSNVATVTITVKAVNDPPVAADDVYGTTGFAPLVIAAPGVRRNDTDMEHDPLAAAVVQLPSKGVLAFPGDGSFTYTAGAGASGEDRFTYRLNDGRDTSNEATVTINIGATE